MKLNLPVQEQLASCENLLIAGMGGGFDVFCGLPIYFELQRQGQKVHLANFSFSSVAGLESVKRLSDTLVGVSAEWQGEATYFPEYYLTQWFRERYDKEVTIWCFERMGVRPLVENYNTLVEHLSIDGILLVDGGVDGLMRGDEDEIGTMMEDTISLLAVNELKQVPTRLIANLAYGVEWEVTYAHVLENIASLTRLGAFLGSCSLVREMEVYRLYEDAILYVQDKPEQRPSVINSSVVSAVQGHFGDYHLTERTKGSRLLITPFIPMYWFFELQAVAKRNLFASELRRTDTVTEVAAALTRARYTGSRRSASDR
jgi:hypothetical protein